MLVATSLGAVPEEDLRVSLVDQAPEPNMWIAAREAVYIGTAFPEAVGTIVRRDVWAVVKRGEEMTASNDIVSAT